MSTQAVAEKPWEKLSWQEKRERRFESWFSAPGVEFVNPEAQAAYRARVLRIVTCLHLKEPDRVPCFLSAGPFVLHYAGVSAHDAMYDQEAMKRACLLFQRDFGGDTCAASLFSIASGRVDEITQTLNMKWAGHGLAEDAEMSQYVEGEYMMADEYDHLLSDPGDFFLRVYFPRTMAAFTPFRKLQPLRNAVGPLSFLGPVAQPDVQAAFQAIIDAGKEIATLMGVQMEAARAGQAAGFPLLIGGGALAPFDYLGDTLRGTHGIMTDIFRRPETLLKAMEAITPWIIEGALSRVNASGRPLVFFALHKGDDTFLSDKNFEIFYWPTLKKVILALVAEGCVPMLFAEGKMNRRLEAIKDLPKSSVFWWFDNTTDMVQAKKTLGEVACISGSVPASLMCLGTPQEVKDYCRKLIEDCGKGGGFILNSGSAHRTTAAHLHAMMDAVKEFGVYY